jgi:uncharacterized lipoprotein YbaY
MLLVRGRIVFNENVPPIETATVYIRLEDISRADARAKLTAEKVMHNFSFVPGDAGLEFLIYGDALDPRKRYGVRVHVDLDGDGKLSKGDYVSTQTYPVTTRNVPADLRIHVHRIS